jgi:hypothetical protein
MKDNKKTIAEKQKKKNGDWYMDADSMNCVNHGTC